MKYVYSYTASTPENKRVRGYLVATCAQHAARLIDIMHGTQGVYSMGVVRELNEEDERALMAYHR